MGWLYVYMYDGMQSLILDVQCSMFQRGGGPVLVGEGEEEPQ